MAHIGGTVAVLATWGGDEQDSFMAMVKPFEDQTGVQIQYTGTRDLNAVLQTRISGNNPPETAGLPGPGQMTQYAQSGKLIDLSSVLDVNAVRQQYSDAWLSLAQVSGKQVGIFIKAAVKGLIWYSPKAFQQGSYTAPKTWDELMTLSQKIASTGTTPWSIGLESGAASGWPGTDWLEDIVLRQAGASVYDQWWQGKTKWTSDQIKTAWSTWGKIVGDPKMVFGGSAAMLSTNFGDAPKPIFGVTPPKAVMVHEASFETSFIQAVNKSLQPGTDFDYFPFPDISTSNTGVTEVAGDLFGMFKNTPQAAGLMKWLTTPEAQSIWVKRGGALSPNKLVGQDVYPDSVSKKLAQTLVGIQTPKFDASDQMPSAMQNAFLKSILDYVKNPGSLDSILSSLDNTQSTSS